MKMRCFYCFEVTYDRDLSSLQTNSYYGPVIEEDEEYIVIENHAENSTIFHNPHFGKRTTGKSIFDSPSAILSPNQRLIPVYNRYIVGDGGSLEYVMGFFFDKSEKKEADKAARICKIACLSEYRLEVKRRIEELQASLSWTTKLINKKMSKFGDNRLFPHKFAF